METTPSCVRTGRTNYGEKVLTALRLDVTLRQYITLLAEADSVTMTKVVEDALWLDREVNFRLQNMKEELRLYAEWTGHNLNSSFSLLIADLARYGLGVFMEREDRSKKEWEK